MDSDLRKAINLCESLGYMVIDKEWIKKLSFHRAETAYHLEYSYYNKEEIERLNEEEAHQRIFNEIKLSGLIKKTQRKEPMFGEEDRNITITTWRLDILE